MTLKFLVDEALCSAHGQCYAAAPELFHADAEGFNKGAGEGWIEVPPGMEEAARLGESLCPETAIRVIEEG
jgi:ferredoxin